MEEVEGENTVEQIIKDEIATEKDEIIIKKDEHIENVAESGAEGKQLPVYKPKDEILCDFCGRGYAKTGISKHRKICLNRNINEVIDNTPVKREGNTQPTAMVTIVPVIEEVQTPPAPRETLKVERQTSKANKNIFS